MTQLTRAEQSVPKSCGEPLRLLETRTPPSVPGTCPDVPALGAPRDMSPSHTPPRSLRSERSDGWDLDGKDLRPRREGSALGRRGTTRHTRSQALSAPAPDGGQSCSRVAPPSLGLLAAVRCWGPPAEPEVASSSGCAGLSARAKDVMEMAASYTSWVSCRGFVLEAEEQAL